MRTSRRTFLQSSLAVAVGFRGLHRLFADSNVLSADAEQRISPGYGPLISDPNGQLDLPKGFRYTLFSTQRTKMDDGFLVPGKHDGMGSFPGPDGTTLLIRNHEMMPDWTAIGGFGTENELFKDVPREFFFDAGHGVKPCLGATTTLVYNTKKQKLEKHFLSLAGTQFNCAGGTTPWGTWITCEENTDVAGEHYEQDHGYPFEVPARADGGLTKPVPIKAMGRFRREAIAVDPRTGIVYQTEDLKDGIITRFIPDRPGELLAGGRLQALCIADKTPCDMRNWTEDEGKPIPCENIPVGQSLATRWIDLHDVEAPKDDLRYRAAANGAAVFARAEGIWYGNDAVYIACTNGGKIGAGQIFRYLPSHKEGTSSEADSPGRLE
ncbi:MAG: alkaline phosphatase PhoX, partial [Phycisphaerae bacterium]